MLTLRLSRSGKTNQVAYKIVVTEHSASVKSNFVEIIGYYNPAENKKINFKMDRVEHWIKMGAKPSRSLAVLLKNHSVPGMEKFIYERKHKKLRKGAEAPAKDAPKKAAVDVVSDVAPQAAQSVEASAEVATDSPAQA